MPFPRSVIFEACFFLGNTIQYQGGLEDMLLRWELDELEARNGSIQQRCHWLFLFLRDNPEVQHDGRLISDLVVEEAARRASHHRRGMHGDALVHELGRAGYLIDEDLQLRRSLPEMLDRLT